MKSELGIYLSDEGNFVLQVWAEHARDVAKRTNQLIFMQSLYSHTVLEHQKPPQKAVVIAGDGLIRACLDNWRMEGEYPAVGIRPGGTSNTLYRALVDAGQTMRSVKFLETPAEELNQTANFYPGVMEEVLFTNTVSFNQYDLANRNTNEKLRKLPVLTGKGRLRVAYAAGLIAAVIAGSPKIPMLEMYLTTPFFGYAKIYPEQETLGRKLTRVSIEGESKGVMIGKLLQALMAMNTGRAPEVGVLKFDQAKAFGVVNNLGHVTMDGDLNIFSKQTTVIRRDSEPISIFALT